MSHHSLLIVVGLLLFNSFDFAFAYECNPDKKEEYFICKGVEAFHLQEKCESLEDPRSANVCRGLSIGATPAKDCADLANANEKSFCVASRSLFSGVQSCEDYKSTSSPSSTASSESVSMEDVCVGLSSKGTSCHHLNPRDKSASIGICKGIDSARTKLADKKYSEACKFPTQSPLYDTWVKDYLKIAHFVDANKASEIKVPEKTPSPTVDSFNLNDEKFNASDKGCGGPVLQSHNQITDTNYTNEDIHKAMESYSHENIAREKNEIGTLNEEEQQIYDKVIKYSPTVSYRIGIGNFVAMMSDPHPELRSIRYADRRSGYANAEENFLFGSFNCVFASLGPYEGYSKYGEVLIKIKSSPNLKMWASDLTGWSYITKKLNLRSHHLQSTPADKLREIRMNFAKGIYTQDDYNQALALMMVKAIRTGKSYTGNSIPNIAEMRKGLLGASSLKEFWDLAIGDPEQKNAAAYLEVKIPAKVTLDNIDQIIVPDALYTQYQALFSKFPDKVIPKSRQSH